MISLIAYKFSKVLVWVFHAFLIETPRNDDFPYSDAFVHNRDRAHDIANSLSLLRP